MSDNKHNGMSIDDILKSVRNVMNEKDSLGKDDSPYEELELTEIADNPGEVKPQENMESIISEKAENETRQVIKEFVETAETLGKKVDLSSSKGPDAKSIENFVLDLMKPQIKEWLDANLPIIVKQTVSEEIKKLVADVNKNSK